MIEFFDSHAWEKIVRLFNRTSLAMFEHDSWRAGQAYMNVLRDIDPRAYEDVTNTFLDPYYDDERINAMLEYLTERWMNEDKEKTKSLFL